MKITTSKLIGLIAIASFFLFCSIPSVSFADGTQSGVSVGIQSIMDAGVSQTQEIDSKDNTNQKQSHRGQDPSQQAQRGLGLAVYVPGITQFADTTYSPDYFDERIASFTHPIRILDYRGLGSGWTLKVTATQTKDESHTTERSDNVLILSHPHGVTVSNQDTLGEINLLGNSRIVSGMPLMVAHAPDGVGMGETEIQFSDNAWYFRGHNAMSSMIEESAYTLCWTLEDAPQ